MKLKILAFFTIMLLLFIATSLAATTGTVTIGLNVSSVWWNDSVNASGFAKYPNETVVSNGTLSLIVDGKTYSCPNSNSNGLWNCSFRAPINLGSYSVMVNVTNSTNTLSLSNTTTLDVKVSYGEQPIGKTDRVVYEQPMLIQEPSGRIRIAWARIKVWRS